MEHAFDNTVENQCIVELLKFRCGGNHRIEGDALIYDCESVHSEDHLREMIARVTS